jgi:hypothetical protein
LTNYDGCADVHLKTANVIGRRIAEDLSPPSR